MHFRRAEVMAMSSRLFPLWMGIEQSHFGENRILVPRQPHLDENPMPKTLDGEDHLVIEPVVITVAVAFLRNLSYLRVLLGSHVPDNLSLQECQATIILTPSHLY